MSSRPRATANRAVPAGLQARGLLVAAVLVATMVSLGTTGTAAAQEGSTEPSVPELIVPGDPTATTLPSETPSTTVLAEAEAPAVDDGLAASTKVWIIIGGLVGVALLVLILTILYWRRTRPSAVAARRAGAAEVASADATSEGEAPAPADLPAEAPSVTPSAAAQSEPAPQPAAPAPAPVSRPAGEVPPAETPMPVGDEAAADPRRSVFAPPPGDEAPTE